MAQVNNTGPNASLNEATAVAVIGMACRFPEADSIEEFWDLLESGKSAVRPLPPHRFNPAAVTREPRNTSYHGNFVRNPDHFDNQFFGLSGREAKSMDPQQRLALQVAYEALESAGYFGANKVVEEASSSSSENDIGCYLGVGAVDYEANVASHDGNAFSALGTLRAFVSGRISHHFGWSGPSITYDTACSSGAVAIHSAVTAIKNGECSMALAGGVSIMTSPDLWQNLAAASFLSPTGASKAFDAGADGYCRGEGAGLVLLKPLSRAMADGNDILAVITGSAVNHGANCSPITVPVSDSQAALYKKALAVAGVADPKDVSYVEAHGTGTPVGDPIECESIRKTFGGADRTHELLLGSVKDNIGHTEAASGAAALIKTVLMLQKRVVPKQANFQSLNPKIAALSPDRIAIPTSTQAWNVPHPIAVVNNYGAAGSNAALVVQRYERVASSNVRGTSAATQPQPYPFFISAKTPESLRDYCTAIRDALPRITGKGGDDHASLAYSLSVKQNRGFTCNYSFVASSVDEVVAALDQQAHMTTTTTVEAVRTKKRPVVLCIGDSQETETRRMVQLDKTLFQCNKLLQKHLGDCQRACQEQRLPNLFPAIFGEQQAAVDLITLHTLLFALQYSSAKAWLDCGLQVDTIVGHGFGQLTALAVAGALSIPDALRFISTRARLLQGQQERTAGDAAIPNNILPGLRRAATSLSFKRPSIRIEACDGIVPRDWSTVIDAETLVQHSRTPVHFNLAVERIARRLGACVFVETGTSSASSVMSVTENTLSRQQDGEQQDNVFQFIDVGPSGGTAGLAQGVSNLWAAGVKVQHWPFHRIHRDDNLKLAAVNLPPYQFHKTSFWLEYIAPNTSKTTATSSKDTSDPPLLEVHERGPDGSVLFLLHTTHDMFKHCTQGHAVLGQSLCPASMYVEMAVCAVGLVVESSAAVSSAAVRNIHISSPLSISSGSAGMNRMVLVQLVPASSGEEMAWAFEVLSRAQLASGGSPPQSLPKTRHASGTIALRPDPARTELVQRLVGTARIDSLTRSTSGFHVLEGPTIYQIFSQVVDYAPYYQGVTWILSKGNEAAAKVKVPAAGHHSFTKPPSNSPSCNPIALDNFLQVAGIHVNCLSERNRNEVFVCTDLGDMILTERFLADRRDDAASVLYKVYCTTSSTATTSPPPSAHKSIVNDILVFDAETGDLVVLFSGAIFQSVSTTSLAKTLAKLNNNVASSIEPMAVAAPESVPQRVSEKIEMPATAAVPTVKRDTGQALLLQVRELFSHVIELPLHKVQSSSPMAEIGVDSLMSTEILAEVKKHFHRDISADVFLAMKDVQALVDFLGKDDDGDAAEMQQQTPEPQKDVLSIQVKQATATETVNLDRPIMSGFDMSTLAAGDVPELDPDLPDVLAFGLRAKELASSSSSSSLWSVLDPNQSPTPPTPLEDASLAKIAQESFAKVRGDIDSIMKDLKFGDFYSSIYPAQMDLVVTYIVEAFGRMSCSLHALQPGDAVGDIAVLPEHTKVKRQLFLILENAGLIKQEPSTTTGNPRFVRTTLPAPSVASSQLLQTILAKFPQLNFEYRLLASTGPKLAECLTGKADPIGILFGTAEARTLMENVYTHGPVFESGTVNLARYLVKLFESFPETDSRPGPIKILEVGAGTGGTTKHLIERLVSTGRKFEYTFTDLSVSFVGAARRKFKAHDFMRYATFNAEEEPADTMRGQFDIVISTNCIHATVDLTLTCSNIRKCLRPDGILCLVELTRNIYWFDLVFGLLDGWWRFNDGRTHALANEELWRERLTEAGYRWIDWTAGASSESNILRVITASPSSPQGEAEGTTHATPAADVMMETITFKRAGNIALQADVYYPGKPSSGTEAQCHARPVALMIHGGGHVMLSRRDIRPAQTDMLLQAGFLPVSIDYRLAPEMTLPDGPMNDVCEALAWARYTLPHLPLKRRDVRADGSQVVAVGWSTGGHLALTLGFTAPARGIPAPDATLALYCPSDYEDPFWTRPNLPFGSKAQKLEQYDLLEGVSKNGPITAYNPSNVALCGWMSPDDARSRIALHMNWTGRSLRVLLNGLSGSMSSCRGGLGQDPTDALPEPTLDQVRAVSPAAQIRAGKYAVPTFLIHGTKDDLIPWQQAVGTHEALVQAGVEAEIRVLEGRVHLFDMFRAYERDESAMAAVREGYEFLMRHARI